MSSNEKEIIGIKVGSLTTSIGKSSKKNNIMTFDLLLLDNNTYRQIPTIYTFESTTNQFIGMIANAHLKKSINYTIENISRLISIDIKSDFGKKEMQYVKYAKWDPQREKFIVQAQDGTATRLPSEIVPSYIGLLKNSYLPNLGKNEEVYINIPDYLTYIQKKKYIQLLNECYINGYLIPESVAYTIYYGYTKSGDLFINSPKRYVLLVDIGHSKTTYILAKYEEKKYEIMDLEIYQFGGRDIDDLLYKYFVNSNNIKESNIKKEKLLKFRFKLYDQIKEIKQMIAVNNEYEIGIDKLDGDDKLNVEITRSEFENVTKDILNKINSTFNKFLEKCYSKVGSNLIIEILSDLIKLPYLKNNMENNKYKIKVSQTVQHDESVAIGCCLYGSFKNNIYPQKNFEGILGYNTTNIYYSINSEQEKLFLKKGEPIPINKTIKVNINKDLKNEVKNIRLFYLPDDINFYSNEYLIMEFNFSPNDDIRNNTEVVDIHLNVEINGIIECKNISYTKNYPINKNKKKSMITFIEKETKVDKKQNNEDDINPFDREEMTYGPISYTKKFLDNNDDNEESKKQKTDNSNKNQIQFKENNSHETDNNKGQNMEKFKEEKKKLEQLLNDYNKIIEKKNLTTKQIDKMDHYEFMNDFRAKIKKASKETEIFTLREVLNNRSLTYKINIRHYIDNAKNNIDYYIQYYKKKIATSNPTEQILLKERLEKLEKLKNKLILCIDKDDIKELNYELNIIIKTNK